MADTLDLNINEIISDKMEKNAKIPVEKSRGNALKYTELI